MKIKKWTGCKKIYKIYKNNSNLEGENKMDMTNIRNDKLALKSLLMKNVTVDAKGRVLLNKDDEWLKETEWDEVYERTKKQQ